MIIYIYVKQCTHCNLKYLGKTKRNPYSYNGSGAYWSAHLKKYKCKPKTLEVHSFEDQNEATSFALKFSESNCIVESSLWANLKYENARDGGSEHLSSNSREKISKAHAGKKLSAETKKRISENHANVKLEKNPMYKKKHKKESIEKMKTNRRTQFGETNPFYGRKHSEETKRKISETKKRNRLLKNSS